MDTPIALREWAVAVKALEQGRQVIVLRKGGIAEETKEFKLESPKFFLFPSYEHQRPSLVKPEASDMVSLTQSEAEKLSDQIGITSYAEVIEDIEINDVETLQRLDKLHIWTEDYAEERLKWKKTKPLHVLILRVYKLETPQIIPMRDSYGGCKSWLHLENFENISSLPMKAVLSEQQFEQQTNTVRNQLKSRVK
ncbi:DUF1802 family protein [Cohnella abietis]|uniref:DUF1802 domain-containing protein n=1 Tax=Cohnella abietis TaxID=2507935 RepID=A0A3T1D2U0_9BACL|nr:DUF1802 family protein [Cohnella abietis]BBI32325.1 hypothetical protein KCTCHS21_17240 [Cohnella abietis]